MPGVCLLALSTSPSPTLRTVYAPQPVCVWRGGEGRGGEGRGEEEEEVEERREEEEREEGEGGKLDKEKMVE